MVVAILTAVWPQLDGVRDVFGKEELHYVVLLAYLVVNGPGTVSLDALIARRLSAPATAPRPAVQPARA